MDYLDNWLSYKYFNMLLYWIKFKSGQGDQITDSTDSIVRQHHCTGLKVIHYTFVPKANC